MPICDLLILMGNIQQPVFGKIIADNLQAYGHACQQIRLELTWQERLQD